MSWELETAAEELRRSNPNAWEHLMQAFVLLQAEAVARMLSAPNVETLTRCQGEARATQDIAERLADAAKVVAKLK